MSSPDDPAATVAALRRDYARASLSEADTADTPLAQFGRWFDEALAAKVVEANACTLATATRDAIPSARIVLLRGYDARGFVFFTNYASQKGRELAQNPRAALVFFWPELERQVRLQGAVTKVARAETEAYFATRPRGSQLGAWASAQSEPVAGREPLEASFAAIEARFDGADVPPPPGWGGYRLAPLVAEFWQGRPSRLHDRIRYTPRADGSWRKERLAP